MLRKFLMISAYRSLYVVILILVNHNLDAKIFYTDGPAFKCSTDVTYTTSQESSQALSTEEMNHILAEGMLESSHFYVAKTQMEAKRNFIDLLGSFASNILDPSSTFNYVNNRQTPRKKDLLESLKSQVSQSGGSGSSSSPLKKRTKRDNKTLSQRRRKRLFISSITNNESSQTFLNHNKLDTNNNNTLNPFNHSRKRRSVSYVLPHQESLTSTIYGTSKIEYCNPRGSIDSNGYMNLCSTCAATTTLSDDYWPRYYNEAICMEPCECILMNNVAHGKCMQKFFYITILKRKKGHCKHAIRDGEEIVTDAWESFQKPVRIGCECTIRRDSRFAQFV